MEQMEVVIKLNIHVLQRNKKKTFSVKPLATIVPNDLLFK